MGDCLKFLLHTCCGPCASACVPRLHEEGHDDVTLFFANSNIDTREEFERRRDAAEKLARAEGIPMVVLDYNHDEWLSEVASGNENEPEKGRRCEKCFRYNLAKTVKYAAENGYEAFATSLTVSPHKISSMVFAANDDIRFAKFDFKKREGFKISVRRAAELGLYRQAYCGCEFSRREMERREAGE